MGWLGSILVALLTGGLGLLAAGLVMNACVAWYRVSHFEGKAGYAVVTVALLGGIAGFVVGLATARVVGTGFLGSLGIASGAVMLLALLSAAVARALADVPPTIDGQELTLEIEVRLPAGATVGTGSEPYFHLHSVVRRTARKSGRGEIRPTEARLEDGRWIVPGSAHLFTGRGMRSIGIVLPGQEPFGFLVPLPARPKPAHEAWSDWFPRPKPPNPPWPDSKPSFRFRVRRIGDTLAPDPAAAPEAPPCRISRSNSPPVSPASRPSSVRCSKPSSPRGTRSSRSRAATPRRPRART